MLFVVVATVANAWSTLPVQQNTQQSAYTQYAQPAAQPAAPVFQSAVFAALCCGAGVALGYTLSQRQATLAVQEARAYDLERPAPAVVNVLPAPVVKVVAPRPVAAPRQRAPVRKSLRTNVEGLKMGFDQEAFISESKEMRLKHLEE